MTLSTPGLGERIQPPDDDSFDRWDPAHISPLVAWLCTVNCRATAQVYGVGGNTISRYLEWTRADVASTEGRWTFDELDEVVGGWAIDWAQSRHLRVTGTEPHPR